MIMEDEVLIGLALRMVLPRLALPPCGCTQ